ncbi:MAG TPA: CAP domain-containing protein, partial [Candidatus Humimicrobiaceae bacterium]
LDSFYDNIAKQLKLFKNKTGQAEIKEQKATATGGEDVKQQEADAGQTESQETASQKQQNQQTAGQAADGQQAGTTGQAENFTVALLSLINNARISIGLQPLSLNPTLNSIAKSRCNDMIARDYFSHVSPEGKDIKSFVEENGIMHKTTGENIQYCSPPSMSGPELFFNSWMDSEVHRANILNPGYSQIGIALSFNTDKALVALVFLG